AVWQLGGEGLGRSDPDLWPSEGWEYQIRFPRDCTFRLIDDRKNGLPLGSGIAECRQGVDCLARLRNEERRPPFRHGGFAIAELARNIQLNRQTRNLLEPVLGDIAGVVSGPTGGDRQARQLDQIQRQIRQGNAAGLQIHIAMQRVADDRGLLVNLLLHEMAKIALADGGARKSRLDY